MIKKLTLIIRKEFTHLAIAKPHWANVELVGSTILAMIGDHIQVYLNIPMKKA